MGPRVLAGPKPGKESNVLSHKSLPNKERSDAHHRGLSTGYDEAGRAVSGIQSANRPIVG